MFHPLQGLYHTTIEKEDTHTSKKLENLNFNFKKFRISLNNTEHNQLNLPHKI